MKDPHEWTDADKALVREIGFAVGEVLIQRHAESCELRRNVKMWKFLATSLAGGIAGGFVAGSVPAAFKWLSVAVTRL